MRFFSYLITNFQQRYLSIRDHYRRTNAASLILILFYNLQLFMIILQIEKQYQIGFQIMKLLFSFSLIIQFGLLVAMFLQLSPLKFRNLENSELIRPIPIKASNNRHINKDVKKIFNFGVSFVLKIYIYIFSQLISWALISIIRQIQNQTNNSSADIFYLVFSIIFQLSNILITFSLSNLEFDLTFKNSDYLGTLFVSNLLRDVCLRQTIIIIITVLQNAQITSIVGITYFLLSSILSFQLQTYCQLYIDLLQSYFKFILGIFILQDYFKIRISQNIYSIILTAPILLKIIAKYYQQQREFCHLNKREFITDQQLRLFYSQIEQYFLKKNQKFNKDKCRQKLSLNIYYQITNHLLNCDKRFTKVSSCYCVQYFPIIRSTMRNWNKYLESDDEENQNDVPKLVNDKKNLKLFLIQLISLQYETQIKDYPNQQYSHYYFLIQVLKRALKVFQNCQILKDKSRHFKQRLIINQLCEISALKLKKYNQTTQSETSNMIVFQFQDSIEIMRMNLNQIFIQLQEFYQMLIDPYFDQQALTKLGEKIINNKDVFQNQLNEISRINAYDQNLQVLVRIYNTYVETQQYFNNHVQYQQPHQQILNKLFVTDSYVVVITFLNQLGAIINSTKNFTSLLQESNNLRGQNINQYMPSVIAQFHNQYLQNYLDGGQSNIIGQEQVYFLLKDSQSYIIPINIQVRIEYNLISEFGASALIQKASNFDNHLILINQFGIIQELKQNSYEFFNQHLKFDIDQIQNINLLMLIPGLHKLLKSKIQQVTSVEIQRPEEIIIIFPTDPIQIQTLKSILLPSESKNINKYFDEQKGFIQRYLNQIHSAKIYNAKIIIQPLKISSQKLFVCDITNISIQEVHDLQKKIQSIQSLSFLGNRNQARSKNMIQAQIKSLKEFEVGNLEKNVINQEELMTKDIKYNLQNYSSSHFQLISNRTIIHSEQNLLSENISFTKQVSQQNYFMEEILEQKGMCDQNQSIQFSNGHQIDILSQTQSKSDYNFKEKLEIAFNVLFQNNSSYQFNIFRIFYAIAYLTLLVINLIIFYQTITQYRVIIQQINQFQWINESEDIYLKKTGNSINIFLLQEFQDELKLDDFQQQLLTDIKWFIQYFSNVQIMMEWKSDESQETFIYSLIEIYEHLIQQLEDGKLLSSVQSQYVNICDQINELYDVLEEHIDNKITDNKQIQIFLTILGYFLTSLTIISLIPVGIYISNGRDKIFQLINTFNIKDLYRCLYRFEHLQKLLDSKQLLNYNSQYDQQMNNLVSDKIQRLQNHRNKLTESRSQIWNKNLQKLLIMVILFSLSQLYLMITLIYQNSFFLAYEHNILKAQRILELKHGMSTCSAVISMIRIDEDSDASEFIQDALDLMKEEFEEQQGWKSIILEIDLGLNVTSSIEDNFCNIFYFDSDEIFNFDQCQQQGLIDDGLIQLLTRYFGQITEIFDYLENDSEFQVEEYLKTDQITLLQKQQIFIQHGLTILYNLQLKDLQQYSEQFKINEIILFVMSFCIFVIIMIIINKFIITYLVNLTFRARRLFTLIPMKLIVENLYVMNYVKNEGKYIVK